MKLSKVNLALLGAGLTILSCNASAHWSSGPFLYNDAGTNPMNLANNNLAVGVANNGVGVNGTGVGTNIATGTSYGTYTQIRATTSDYGWVEGLDPVLWGNSHDMRGLAFSLGSTSTVTFKITTLGTASSMIQTQATGAAAITTLSGIDWAPAFSLYSGLATQSSHEGGIGNTTLKNNLPGYAPWSPYATENPITSATVNTYNNSAVATGVGIGSGYFSPAPGNYAGTASNGTWGAFRSDADWVAGRDVDANAIFGNGNLIGTDLTLGGQNAQVLDYLGSAQAQNGTHSVTATYTLGPGDYSIWVGGTNATNAAQQLSNYQNLLTAINANDTAAILAASDVVSSLRKNYGFSIETTVAAPVPLPSAAWLFFTSLSCLLGFTRSRKSTSAS